MAQQLRLELGIEHMWAGLKPSDAKHVLQERGERYRERYRETETETEREKERTRETERQRE